MQKILIADDEISMRKVIRRFLSAHSFSVITADNGNEAFHLAREMHPQLILADENMPGLNGHELCRTLKKNPETASIPVILMSGRKMEEGDILAGFDCGADDYILKPFSLSILIAKLRALLHHYENHSQTNILLKKYRMELDLPGRILKIAGKTLPLTRKEFDLLVALTHNINRVLSVPSLLESVWGYDPAKYNDPHTVEVHVFQLRKKLGPKIAGHLVNVTGYGYKFEE